MKIYLVGGAVRDQLLGIPIKDRDWVVVGATPEEMMAAGYKRADVDFPVFLHPQTGEEYALARVEYKTGCGYKGFEIYSGQDVTLEQDLKRRDFTINAMAQDAGGNIIDPFNGQDDLQNGIIRHVSPAFAEDPVRILRAARFAARFHRYGFHISHSTHQLMKTMVQSGESRSLTPARVWMELSKALAEPDPEIFFQVLHMTGALNDVFPELESSYESDSEAHTSSPQPLPLCLLQNVSGQTAHKEQRWAVLLYGLYLCDPDQDSKAISQKFNVPAAFRDLSDRLITLLATIRTGKLLDAEFIFRALEKLGAYRNPDDFFNLLQLANLLPDTDRSTLGVLEDALKASQSVSADVLLEQGLHGKELGNALKRQKLAEIRAILGNSHE